MAYCIMRIEKRRRAAVYGLQIEANRSQADHAEKGRDFASSDICWELTPFNLHLVKADSWGKAITTAIKDAGATERKNSVVLLDGFYGASKEWFADKSLEQIVAFFKDCLAFHEREYGKVLNAVIHFDEATPHLQVASIPLIADEQGCRLSAKEVMGNRNDYRKRQDLFFEQVGKPRGMERGEIHDPEAAKKHLSVQEYKNKTLEQQNKKLTERNKELQRECKRLRFCNNKLKELNVTLSEQVEQPFLQYCMMEFIRKAKVRGENGEVKLVIDGFNSYMGRNAEQLRAAWAAQFEAQEGAAIEHYNHVDQWEREIEYDYDLDGIERG